MLAQRFAALIAAAVIAPAVAAPPVRYHDETYKFSLTPPVFPENTALGIPTTPVDFHGPPKDGGTPFCNVQIQSAAVAQAAFLEISRNQFSALGGTMVSEETRKVSGKQAVVWHVRAVLQEMLVLAVFTDRRVYVVSCASPPMQYLDWEDKFKATIDSFTLD